MMRFLTAAALAAAAALPAAADDKKPATIKLMVPDRPTRTAAPRACRPTCSGWRCAARRALRCSAC